MAFYFTWNKIQFLYYRLLGPAWPGLCPSFPLHLMSGSPYGSVIFGHIDLSVTQTYTVVFPTHCSTSLSLLHLFKCYVLKRPPPTTQFKSRLLPRASTMFYLSSFFVPFFLCSLSQYLFFSGETSVSSVSFCKMWAAWRQEWTTQNVFPLCCHCLAWWEWREEKMKNLNLNNIIKSFHNPFPQLIAPAWSFLDTIETSIPVETPK